MVVVVVRVVMVGSEEEIDKRGCKKVENQTLTTVREKRVAVLTVTPTWLPLSPSAVLYE